MGFFWLLHSGLGCAGQGAGAGGAQADTMLASEQGRGAQLRVAQWLPGSVGQKDRNVWW